MKVWNADKEGMRFRIDGEVIITTESRKLFHYEAMLACKIRLVCLLCYEPSCRETGVEA